MADEKESAEQFLRLLPLTAQIAGLPLADHGKYFNEDQMELRARSLLHAYKQAQVLIGQIAEQG